MNRDKLKSAREKFFEGALSSEEELQFKNLLSESENTEDEVVKNYFALIETADTGTFTPVPKARFFATIGSKRRKKQNRMYGMAAAVACIVIAFAGYWAIYDKQHTKKLSQTEIDRSLETTKLALNSFSKYFDKGFEKIGKGIDFSRPFDSLSKIHIDEIKTDK